jgi:hypothetical protein
VTTSLIGSILRNVDVPDEEVAVSRRALRSPAAPQKTAGYADVFRLLQRKCPNSTWRHLKEFHFQLPHIQTFKCGAAARAPPTSHTSRSATQASPWRDLQPLPDIPQPARL